MSSYRSVKNLHIRYVYLHKYKLGFFLESEDGIIKWYSIVTRFVRNNGV